MIKLLLLLTFVSVQALPVLEYDGLLSLYHGLDGSNWIQSWDVSLPRYQACCQWTGLSCSCPDATCSCTPSEVQSVRSLHLKGVGMSGSFTKLNISMLSSLLLLEADNNPSLIAGAIPEPNTWLPSSITQLTISNTSRIGMAPSFESISQLVNLVLSHNSIINCPALPSKISYINLEHNNISTCSFNVFSNATDITSIYINNNHLVNLPDLSGLAKLRTLSASFNNISSFPIFSNPSSIVSLQLSWNQFSFPLTESFFASFASLGELFLDNNHLIGIVPTFHNNTRLTTIVLSGNQLTGIMPLFRLPSLFWLNLSSNWLQGHIQPFTLPDKGFASIVDVSCNHMQGPLPTWPIIPSKYVYDWYDGSDESYCPKAVRTPTSTPSSSSSFSLSWPSLVVGLVIGAIGVVIVACARAKLKSTRPRVPLSSLSGV